MVGATSFFESLLTAKAEFMNTSVIKPMSHTRNPVHRHVYATIDSISVA